MRKQFEKIQIEKYVKANSSTSIIDMLHDVLSSESSRVNLAVKITDDMQSAANLLGISERTLYRKVGPPKDLIGEG